MVEPVVLLPSSGMGVYEIWDGLYQCGVPETSEDWDVVFGLSDIVVSLGMAEEDTKPDVPAGKMRIRWSIDDGPLPDMVKLDLLTETLASWVSDERRVLIHCAAGLNRSGLLSALTVRLLTGESGRVCVEHVRQRKPGSLINGTFNRYLNELPEPEQEEFPELGEGEVDDRTSAATADSGANGETEEGRRGQGG